MLYGCCVNLLPKTLDRIGLEYAGRLKRLGYDYIELPLNELAQLSEQEFRDARTVLEELDLPCRACNDFMPARFQITGPDVTSRAELTDYLRRALERGEQMAVYGDYDVDGITSTCLLTHYLRAQGGDVCYYIPNRLSEGYGVNREAVEELARQGVRGENAAAIRAEVEHNASSIATAFENQLDALYAAESMDLSADLTVLQNMLKGQGLSK